MLVSPGSVTAGTLHRYSTIGVIGPAYDYSTAPDTRRHA